MPPVSEQELALATARELLNAIAQSFAIVGKSIPLTATIGIAFYPLAPSLEELRRQAGVAMGEAKREGGNRCKIYSRPIFGLETSKDLQLAADLQQAWQRKSLQVLYQPRVDIRKNKIAGVGAVVRWNHPVIGWISSAKVQSLAEESGFRPELDEWVLRTACQQAKTWHTSGIYLRVSCQISAKMFESDNFCKTVAESLKSVGLESQFLELEIAADTVATAKNANATASKFMALKRLGVKTTISQFGLGHTTLSYLGQMGLDSLKIEGSLVANISQNAPVISAIIQMAHGLKIRTVADGISGEAQVDVLIKLNCDEFQKEAFWSEAQIKSMMGKR
jgi:EAL domain-containing protein (putative c-di-GMP-specific phosphodiesterase class I)